MAGADNGNKYVCHDNLIYSRNIIVYFLPIIGFQVLMLGCEEESTVMSVKRKKNICVTMAMYCA